MRSVAEDVTELREKQTIAIINSFEMKLHRPRPRCIEKPQTGPTRGPRSIELLEGAIRAILVQNIDDSDNCSPKEQV